MLKNLTQFKSTIEGVENCFLFDMNCPIGIAKQALFECLKWIGQIEDQAKANEKAEKELKTEEKKEVVDDESCVGPEPSV